MIYFLKRKTKSYYFLELYYQTHHKVTKWHLRPSLFFLVTLATLINCWDKSYFMVYLISRHLKIEMTWLFLGRCHCNCKEHGFMEHWKYKMKRRRFLCFFYYTIFVGVYSRLNLVIRPARYEILESSPMGPNASPFLLCIKSTSILFSRLVIIRNSRPDLNFLISAPYH